MGKHFFTHHECAAHSFCGNAQHQFQARWRVKLIQRVTERRLAILNQYVGRHRAEW